MLKYVLEVVQNGGADASQVSLEKPFGILDEVSHRDDDRSRPLDSAM